MSEKENINKKIANTVNNPEFLYWIIERNWNFNFPMYPGASYMQEPMEALELTERSKNCLRRAGFRTISEVVNAIETKEDLMHYRNLGKRSADEILLKLFLYQYEKLSPERQKKYVDRVYEMN